MPIRAADTEHVIALLGQFQRASLEVVSCNAQVVGATAERGESAGGVFGNRRILSRHPSLAAGEYLQVAQRTFARLLVDVGHLDAVAARDDAS